MDATEQDKIAAAIRSLTITASGEIVSSDPASLRQLLTQIQRPNVRALGEPTNYVCPENGYCPQK